MEEPQCSEGLWMVNRTYRTASFMLFIVDVDDADDDADDDCWATAAAVAVAAL